MKRYSILLLVIFLSVSRMATAGGHGYKIKLKVKGIKDTTAYLGYYFADKKFSKDTIHFNSNGEAIAEGKEPLEQGIYMFIFPSMKNVYFEVLIGKDQDFSLETDTSDFLQHMVVKGNKELSSFYDYQKKMIEFSKERNELNKKYRDLKKTDTAKASAVKKDIEAMSDKVEAYWDKIIKDNPKTFLATLITAMKEPKMPEFKVPEDVHNKDSVLQMKRYYFTKNHFFDNFDLGDARLLRSPMYDSKVKYYMTRIVIQDPDTVIKEGHKLIEAASKNKETFRYMVAYMLGYYEETHLMGMDKVFVDIAENYYLNGKADWVTDSVWLGKVRDRVKKIKPNIIGYKAADMQMMELYGGGYTSLYKTKADYLILVFWSPDCGHCKKAAPKMVELEKEYRDKGVKIFAVCTEVNKDPWTEFIKKYHTEHFINVIDPYNYSKFRDKYDIYSTPTVYLLDKDKKIIAKRLDLEQLKELLNRHLNEKKK